MRRARLERRPAALPLAQAMARPATSFSPSGPDRPDSVHLPPGAASLGSFLRIPLFPRDPSALRETAREGTRTPAAELPFAERLQRAFGRHDLGPVRAHLGRRASVYAGAIDARAYAAGEHVVFSGSPDLHTAAHEAAHVIQQRAGAKPPGGVGRDGDAQERHADAIAGRVVAGRSAEDLLNRTAGEPRPAGSRPPAPPATSSLPVVQRKREWEEHREKATQKWSDWSDIYGKGKTVLEDMAQEIKDEGTKEEKTNKDPAPENDTQKRLGKQAAGLLDWVKGFNSTAGGKIYELLVADYHREQFGSESVFLGADDRTEPDITMVDSQGRRRAEEAKMVSVEDPGRIDEMVRAARQQLDKDRAGTGAGYREWKIRTRIHDRANPWPGTGNTPPTDANFLISLVSRLISMDWRKSNDGAKNSLHIDGINPPADSGLKKPLVLEAVQETSSTGYARTKVWHFAVDFRLSSPETKKKSARYRLKWNSKPKSAFSIKPALGKLSEALSGAVTKTRLSLSPQKTS